MQVAVCLGARKQSSSNREKMQISSSGSTEQRLMRKAQNGETKKETE